LKYIILILGFYCFSLSSSGQIIQRQTTGVAGTNSQFDYGSLKLTIQSSIGQASVIGAKRSGSAHLRQGFIQPLGVKTIRRSVENNLDALVYPNPFRDEFTIAFDRALSAEVRITDSMGRPVFKTRLENIQYTGIEPGNLSAGTYIIFIRSGNKLFKGQIIKYR